MTHIHAVCILQLITENYLFKAFRLSNSWFWKMYTHTNTLSVFLTHTRTRTRTRTHTHTHTHTFKNNSALYTLLGDVQRGVRFVVPGFQRSAVDLLWALTATGTEMNLFWWGRWEKNRLASDEVAQWIIFNFRNSINQKHMSGNVCTTVWI